MDIKYNFFPFLFCIVTYTAASKPISDFPKDTTAATINLNIEFRNAGPVTFNSKGNRITDFGAGIALWYKSDQPGIDNLRFPLHLFAEYGNSKKALSGFVDFSFFTQYVQSDFVLKPLYLNLDLKYSFIKGFKIPVDNFDVFAVVGPDFWYASLSDRGYPGVIGYENKIEKDMGIGLNGGLGSSYRFKRYKISAMFIYSTGMGEYYAGQFSKQKIYTGTYQAVLLFSYAFLSKKGVVQCPAYR